MTGQFIKPSLLLYCSPYSYLLRCNRISGVHQIPLHRNLHRLYKRSLLKREFTSITNKCNPKIHSVLLFSTCSCNCRTHYEVLGVDINATQKEIKAAYIKLGLKWHPDLHQNLSNDESPDPKDKVIDHEELDKKFKEINEAYEILGKHESRKMYDLSLPGTDSTNNGAGDSNGHHKGPYRTYETAEQRGQAFYGYPGTDPDYYKKNPDKWKIAGLCVVAIVFGFLIHFTIAKLSADAHGRYLDQNTERINQQLRLARENNKKSIKKIVKGSEEYNRIVESLKEETELPKFLR